MPLIKRSFYIPCRGEECFKLAELIKEKTPVVESIEISIGERGLYIYMYGYKSDVKNAWEYIRNMISSYRSSVIDMGSGLKRIKINHIVEIVKHTFPPRLLNEILVLMNYKSSISENGDELITNAPIELITEVAGKIVNAMNEVKHVVRGTTAKYYIVGLKTLLDIPLDEIYRVGLMLKHLYLDEDEKYRLRVEWRRGLREFINFYKGG